jgi:hypothetical protein
MIIAGNSGSQYRRFNLLSLHSISSVKAQRYTSFFSIVLLSCTLRPLWLTAGKACESCVSARSLCSVQAGVRSSISMMCSGEPSSSAVYEWKTRSALRVRYRRTDENLVSVDTASSASRPSINVSKTLPYPAVRSVAGSISFHGHLSLRLS